MGTEGVGNSMGSGKAKELICMTHGHELWGGELLEEIEVLGGGGQKLGKNETTVIA